MEYELNTNRKSAESALAKDELDFNWKSVESTPAKDKSDFNWKSIELVEAIDWNEIEDDVDKQVWDRLISNFWVPEKIPLSNDLPSWANFTAPEKLATTRAFMGLTLLDTIQGRVGADALKLDAITPHEKAVYNNIGFMEDVHAKSYSSIFSTLISTEERKEVYRWSRENEFLKKKGGIILHYYRGNDPEKKKIASALLESFLFYSGFFVPFWWSTKGKLTNTADMLRLIVRDEAIHGYYIGYKFQVAYKKSTPERQAELKAFFDEISGLLYANEVKYTEHLYDEIGITEHVKAFLRYNLNKAAQNLGFEAPFEGAEKEVPEQIIASLNPAGDENHDFFSGSGSSYVIGKAEELSEEDWDWAEE